MPATLGLPHGRRAASSYTPLGREAAVGAFPKVLAEIQRHSVSGFRVPCFNPVLVAGGLHGPFPECVGGSNTRV